MKVIWLRPSVGDNISVRRERIAAELEKLGYDTEIRDASGLDAISAVWHVIKGDYDVIAGNVRMGLYIGYPLARLLRKPFLGDVSDPITDIDHLPKPLYRLLGWYETQVLKRADAAVFVYESSYQKAIQNGVKNAFKLPNAVDYEAFSNPDERVIEETQRILEDDGVSFNKPIVIHIGKLSKVHGVPTIIEAARITPDWDFVLVGESGMEKEVREASNELENVHYPGSFEYRLMPGFLYHADVGFCFKDAEQPLKVKEYGAAGIPAVVQHGDLGEWYEDDELFFVDLNPNEISQALDDLEDEELRAEYGSNLQQIAKDYRWDNIAQKYHELFQAMVE